MTDSAGTPRAEPGEGQPEETLVAYRPVGQGEMDRLIACEFTARPPRHPIQPFFDPVTSEEYALEIARPWELPRRSVAWATRFRGRGSFLPRYEIHQVGASRHTEWWIPAQDPPELNANLVGKIEIVHELRADG